MCFAAVAVAALFCVLALVMFVFLLPFRLLLIRIFCLISCIRGSGTELVQTISAAVAFELEQLRCGM